LEFKNPDTIAFKVALKLFSIPKAFNSPPIPIKEKNGEDRLLIVSGMKLLIIKQDGTLDYSLSIDNAAGSNTGDDAFFGSFYSVMRNPIVLGDSLAFFASTWSGDTSINSLEFTISDKMILVRRTCDAQSN
jgi:hypothetical protein